jgi:hypothetical protein
MEFSAAVFSMRQYRQVAVNTATAGENAALMPGAERLRRLPNMVQMTFEPDRSSR